MRMALKIFSIIAVVTGIVAILGSSTSNDLSSAFIGGGLFLTEGILALVYISQQEGK